MSAPHSLYNRALQFTALHERKIGAVLFAFGFLTDLFTFGTLPIDIVNWFFITYLVLAVITIVGTHSIFVFKTRDVWWKKTLALMFPLGAQYAFGGLFSGFVVFYARSSVFSVSWPFLLLLLLMYAGNEYFRKEREHLIFQSILFFFALYAYSIFAFPLLVHTLGPLTFLGSTVLALVLFGAFLYLLFLIHRKRIIDSFRFIVSATVGVTVVICLSYFAGLIPPLPLALVDEGIYHTVTKVSGGYEVTTEAPAPWWHIGPPVLHVPPGGALSALSAIRAPIQFSSSVVHRWESYNTVKGRWVVESVVSFPLSGGRADGYRGYSIKENIHAGKWRVSVETPNGQTIGQIRFTVEEIASLPALTTYTR